MLLEVVILVVVHLRNLLLLSRLLMVVVVSTIVVACLKEVNTAIFFITWVSMPFSALFLLLTIPILILLLKAALLLYGSSVGSTSSTRWSSRLLLLKLLEHICEVYSHLWFLFRLVAWCSPLHRRGRCSLGNNGQRWRPSSSFWSRGILGLQLGCWRGSLLEARLLWESRCRGALGTWEIEKWGGVHCSSQSSWCCIV